MTQANDVFVSYARADRTIASAIIRQLETIGVKVWSDFRLVPGETWRVAIQSALNSSSVLVVIATQTSARSPWVLQEIVSASRSGRPVVPVVVGDLSVLPPQLRAIQSIFLDPNNEQSLTSAARQIQQAVVSLGDKGGLADISAELAKDLAAEADSTGDATPPTREEQSSCFVVHGHDEPALKELTDFLKEIQVSPIVLKDVEDSEESLLNRFFRVAGEARVAVVIVSPDDKGASRLQYDEPAIGEKSLRFRARQNVILELGFFYGKLGFQNVYVLLKEPSEKWPDFELPSDITGAVFKRMDKSGLWKVLLKKKMIELGLKLN